MIHCTAPAEYCFASHAISISHSRAQVSHIWMHCLTKRAYLLELNSVFSELLTSLPVSLYAHPQCMPTPLLAKSLNFIIELQRHYRILFFRFVVNQINWFKISTETSDKNIPNYSYTPTGVGADKFWRCEEILSKFPQKNSKENDHKKRLYLISCWAHFFNSRSFKHHFGPNFP